MSSRLLGRLVSFKANCFSAHLSKNFLPRKAASQAIVTSAFGHRSLLHPPHSKLNFFLHTIFSEHSHLPHPSNLLFTHSQLPNQVRAERAPESKECLRKKKSKGAKGKAKLKGKTTNPKVMDQVTVDPVRRTTLNGHAEEEYGHGGAGGPLDSHLDFRLEEEEDSSLRRRIENDQLIKDGDESSTSYRSGNSTERDAYGEKRGRTTRPRLLWISTLGEEALRVLDYHHERIYGEPIPRLRGPGSEEGRRWSEELDKSGL